MCGHSFHPRHTKTACPGDPGFGGMAAPASVSWSTALARMLRTIPPGSRRKVRTKLTKRTKLSKLLNQEDALGAPCLQRFAITVARPGSRGVAFAWACANWKPSCSDYL
jgi:hypothetical protein